MSNKYARLEILLMINTSFATKTWSRVNQYGKDDILTAKEQLMEACWNGLTPLILPECFENAYDKFLTLWGITDANTFIDLEFGEFMQRKENGYSINPYAFMQVQGYN